MSKVKFDPSKAIDNINSIIKEKNLKQEAISAITGAKQSNVSTILNKKKTAAGSYKFFTVEQLAALSIEWDIPINELLGINTEKSLTTKLTARSICKLILNLKDSNMFMTITKPTEYCYYNTVDFNGMSDICEDKRTNEYIAFYFSNWLPIQSREDREMYWNIGNEYENNVKINTFLSRLRKIHKMKLDGDIDDEMYNILLEKYLEDVPDK